VGYFLSTSGAGEAVQLTFGSNAQSCLTLTLVKPQITNTTV
jgi:hypothetical protein